jgi:hypothetical protein
MRLLSCQRQVFEMAPLGRALVCASPSLVGRLPKLHSDPSWRPHLEGLSELRNTQRLGRASRVPPCGRFLTPLRSRASWD